MVNSVGKGISNIGKMINFKHVGEAALGYVAVNTIHKYCVKPTMKTVRSMVNKIKNRKPKEEKDFTLFNGDVDIICEELYDTEEE